MDKYRNWFVVQAKGGSEIKVRNAIDSLHIKGLDTLLPLRRLYIKRSSVFKWELKPLFPGYLFIHGKIDAESYKRIVKLTGVIKIIRNTRKEPKEVPEEEMRLIFDLMKFSEEEIIMESQAIMVNDRVSIVSGPLKGISGSIVSVNKRKQQATVRVPFFGTYKNINLSFEFLEKEA